jgi:hypothetical protein
VRGRNRRFLLGPRVDPGAGLRKPNWETEVFMKRILIVVVLVLIAGIVAVGILGLGCSKERKVETNELTQSFAPASPEVKAEVEKALAAIKTRDFTTALTSLKTVAESEDLTEAQKQSLGNTVTDITVIISENPPANADELFDMVADITDAVSY